VPHVPALSISETLPRALQDVAWGGFPYEAAALWGGLLGTSNTLKVAAHPDLQAEPADGKVDSLHQGDYWIVFNGPVDHGNSGGPLFDPATGAVYGVVDAFVQVPGSSASQGQIPGSAASESQPYGSASSVYYDLAISARQALPFVGAQPVTVAFTASSGSGDRVQISGATRGPQSACLTAMQDFDRAYGSWLQAHGFIRTVAQAWRTQPVGRPSETTADGIAQKYVLTEGQWLQAMRTSAAAIEHTNTPNPKQSQNASKTALAVVGAASGVDLADASLATAISSDRALQNVDGAEKVLFAAASRLKNSLCFFQ
jgi:hypothetical protein